MAVLKARIRAIAASGIGVIAFQLQPALGGIEYSRETIERVTALDGVIAIKEASFDRDRCAETVKISAKPVLMCVTVAAAASFLTPVATPANLMVMRPGGYRFGDYWKLGLPLLILFGIVSVLLVPVIWRF
jgi:hypothetical protein